MVGRDEALVTEEHVDVAPVERTRREPLVALGARSHRPRARSNAGALVTTRSAKCVGTSSTTRSSPGMAMTSNLPEVRDSHARCSPMDRKTVVRLRGQRGRVDRAAPAPGPRQPDRLRGADTTRDARRPRLRSGLAQRAPRRRRSSRSTPRSRWSSRCARSRPPRWPVQADLERLPFRRGALQRRVGAQVATCTSRRNGCRWRSPSCTGRSRSAARCTSRSRRDRSQPRTPTTASPGATSRGVRRRSSATSSRAPASTMLSSVDDGEEWIDVEATRARIAPRHGRPGMRVLIVGLNPSVLLGRRGRRLRAARQPVLARRSSRPGSCTRPHDPFARAARRRRRHDQPRARAPTPRADELAPRRVPRRRGSGSNVSSTWLQPRAVCFVGLTGYRVAVDRKARGSAGKPSRFGGAPAYVMPNTSGLNAHAKPADFVEHFRVVHDRAMRPQRRR